MSLRDQHRITVHGAGSHPTLVLLHGFGCDQAMWTRLLPHLSDYQVITYDQAGAGRSDPARYDARRHRSLAGYAEDLIEICAELELEDVVVVGHSISSMTAVLAHQRAPDVVTGLVLLAPTPRFTDDPPYVGGLTREEIVGFLDAIGEDYRSWAEQAAPFFMGNPDRPELAAELTASLQRAHSGAVQEFAPIALLSDLRELLPMVQCPTLVVAAASDPIVPDQVGAYVHERIPGSRYERVASSGHFPHVSEPARTAAAITAFLDPIRSFLRRTRS